MSRNMFEVHVVLRSREGKDFTVVAVRNQCRECKLLIISKVFLSGLHNHRGFAKLDAGHPLVRLWLPPSWQITHRDSVSLADVVCCVPTISAPPPTPQPLGPFLKQERW